MRKSIIIREFSSDHEFIYPFYRLLEEGFEVDVCLHEKPGKEYWEHIPPNKNHAWKINSIKTEDYDFLIGS